MEKNMNDDVSFLQLIYKNAEMGIIGIDSVITKINNREMEALLKGQKEEYESICKDADNILKKYGKQKEDISMLAKVSTEVMSGVSLLKNSSTNNIAKMMVEGTNKGIIEITEKINAYNNNDMEIVELANKLKEILENNIEELKKYL